MFFGKTKYDDLQLNKFSIESAGGMSGGRTCLSVIFDESGDYAAVYNEVSPWWYSQPQAECRIVDKAIIDDIKKIIIDNKLYKAPDMPISDMIVYDAATTYYKASFSGGEYFQYNSAQELPAEIWSSHSEIKTIIEEYNQNGTSCPTVYAGNIAAEEYVDLRHAKGVALTVTNGGAPGKIMLTVYNGSDGDGKNIGLEGKVVLSKMDGDDVVSSVTLIDNYTMDIYSGSSDYVYLNIDSADYKEEGTYKIEYAGYETTFEMKIYGIQW